ncbi:hypothetical protein [Pseudonocardia alni]|uniref:hypothetical protein n=1 Tax=Pseudonocardia alni TaxID=33907 RepID=UPI00280B0055|nr:hypothetical protein [Pseudonocardia alni]
MPRRRTSTAVNGELDLTGPERVVGLVLCAALLQRAVNVVGDKRRAARADAQQAVVRQLLYELKGCSDTAWCRELDDDLAVTDPEIQAAAVAHMADLAAHVRARSRSLLVLIDVCMFDAPDIRWDARLRRTVLVQLTSFLGALDRRDLDRVTAEIATVRRAVARRQTKWGRVAVASAVGVGIGVATMGAATPAIAAAVAGAGLSGAAATSAGLAVLGGGSLAAGGFGMAGGSILLAGIGVVSGLGTGVTGSWFAGWSASRVTAEALRLAVATRLVVLDEDHDEELAKRIVLAMQERLDDVTAALDVLSRRLHELREANTLLTAENRQLRAQLRVERVEALQIETALGTALERIRSAGPGDGAGDDPVVSTGAAG